MAVDLALLGSYDPRRSALEWPIVTAAKPHAPHPLYLLQTVPGIGKIPRLVLRYAIHDIQRFSSVQDVLSYRRLVTCATALAGTRDGTAGAKIGHAYLTWAFLAAAVLFVRNKPAGQQDVTPLANKHGQGQALTLLAQQLGRAVYDLVKRQQAFDRHQFLHTS